jgi:D-alanine-D-alanine ligase
MRVAILYNARPLEPIAAEPDDAFEEYDGPETIAAIAAALERIGVTPVPVVADQRLPWRLDEGRFDFVFNIAEGAGRRCREALPSAVCELLGIPFTGSDALTLAVTLDKAVARRIVSPDVAVARGVLVPPQPGTFQLDGLRFPVIVKPNDEGSSKGITGESVCDDAGFARARCAYLHGRYGCPALVEEFLPGMEVTVGVKGNNGDATIVGAMEVTPAEPCDARFVYSLELKRDFRRRIRYHVPPRLDAATLARIETDALTAYRLLGCRDLARIDFRLDANGQPRFLECNPLPGLNPESSDLARLAEGRLTYDQLVQGILLDAAARLGVSVA